MQVSHSRHGVLIRRKGLLHAICNQVLASQHGVEDFPLVLVLIILSISTTDEAISVHSPDLFRLFLNLLGQLLHLCDVLCEVCRNSRPSHLVLNLWLFMLHLVLLLKCTQILSTLCEQFSNVVLSGGVVCKLLKLVTLCDQLRL